MDRRPKRLVLAIVAVALTVVAVDRARRTCRRPPVEVAGPGPSGADLADRVRTAIGPLERELDMPRVNVWADRHVVWSFAVTTVAAVLLALALAAPPVARRLNALVDPVGWIVSRRPVKV